MAGSPNAIAGTQAAGESQDVQLEAQDPVPGEPETPVAPTPGEGESETPEVSGAEGGTGTEGGEPAGEPTETPLEEPQPRKSDVQKRIDALTRRRYQLETQNTQLQNELEDLRRQVGGAGKPAQPGQATQPSQVDISQVQIDPAQLGLPPRPVKDNFESHDQYVETLAAWNAVYEVRRQAVISQHLAEQTRQQSAQNEIIQNWNTSLEKAREKYDDFDEVVGTQTKIPQAAFNAIIDSPYGTEIAYYLGKHPEEMQALNGLKSDNAVVRAMGRIEAKVEAALSTSAPATGAAAVKPAQPAPKPATPPAAKPAGQTPAQAAPAQKPKPKPSQPITPVGTSRPVAAAGNPAVNPDQLPYQEYKKWRDANGARR